MSQATDNNMLVGLDIGTSKIVAIVGQLDSSGGIEIVGLGTSPSRGLKKVWWLISIPLCSRFVAQWKRRN